MTIIVKLMICIVILVICDIKTKFIKCLFFFLCMTDNLWRESLDPLIEENLREILKESREYDYAISKSSDKGKAQLWTAIAVLNHKLNCLKMQNEMYEKKIPEQELGNILKTLESL